MCLALGASEGLWLRYATLQNLIPSFAPTPSTLMQSKERKGSNFAIWQHCISFQAVGIFLAGCFVFTFLAMLEYSVASYLERGNHKISVRRMSVVSGGLRPSVVDLGHYSVLS